MHELSLACELVDLAEQSVYAASAGQPHAAHVKVVYLRLGVLAGVEIAALRIGYESAIAGTLLAGAQLEIEEVPALGWCEACAAERQPLDVQWLACPVCLTPLARLSQGREIEIRALEITAPESAQERDPESASHAPGEPTAFSFENSAQATRPAASAALTLDAASSPVYLSEPDHVHAPA